MTRPVDLIRPNCADQNRRGKFRTWVGLRAAMALFAARCPLESLVESPNHDIENAGGRAVSLDPRLEPTGTRRDGHIRKRCLGRSRGERQLPPGAVQRNVGRRRKLPGPDMN